MNAHVRGVSLLAVAALAAACASSPASQSASEPAGKRWSPTLAGAFQVGEQRRGSDDVRAPRTTLVDYRAKVVFEPLHSALGQAVGVNIAPREGLTAERAQQLEDSIEAARQALTVTADLRALVELIARYTQKLEAFQARELAAGTVVQLDAQWRDLTALQSQIVKDLNRLAIIHVSFRDHDGKWTPANYTSMPDAAFEPFDDAVAEVYTQMSPDVAPGANEQQEFVPERVTEVLNDTTARIRARLQAMGDDVLAKSPEAELEIEAKLRRGQEELPVSISPYTIVKGVERGMKSPRVGVPSERDLERVTESYEQYVELSRSLNELRDLAADDQRLRASLDGIRDTLRAAAERLADGLQARLEKLTERGEAALDGVRTKAQALLDDVKQMQRTWKALLDEPQGDPLTFTRRVTELLGAVKDESFRSKLDAVLTSLPSVEDLEGEVATFVEQTREQLVEERDALLGAIRGVPGVGSLASVFTTLAALRAQARAASFGDVEPREVARNPVDIRRAEVGIVDLDDTPAESGDELEVTYKVTKKMQDGKTRTYVASDSLDVRKFGFYTSLKSQILFYDRLDDGSSTYSAAPGISYNLHHRPESAQGFHDLVAPGVGVSVSAPNFENGTELAVGLQLTLFNDTVQVGYAHNLSVENDQGMFYFGLDLIGVFQAAR